jgi:hypothetical protein
MFIISKGMPPSVTNLTQTPFFLGILCQFEYSPFIERYSAQFDASIKAAPILLRVPTEKVKAEPVGVRMQTE